MKKKIQDGLWILLGVGALVCFIYTATIIVVRVSKGVEKASEHVLISLLKLYSVLKVCLARS